MSKYCIVLMLLAIGLVIAQDPQAILPPKFSQSFFIKHIQDDKYVTEGKLWVEFDSKDQIDNWRIDWSNSYCAQAFPDAKICRLVGSKTTRKVYLFAPLQGLCTVNDYFYTFSRDFFNDLQYKGIRSLNNENYYWWYGKGFFDTEYLTDMSQSLKPRRYGIIGSEKEEFGYIIEALINSYSDKFNSTTVFQIPKYCQNQETIIQQNFESLKKIKFIQRLLSLINETKKTKKNLLGNQ